ncbi:Aromatic/aminoadipate aminotransferase 1 [Podospora fimiseda]|uniref:aromatic-amino-acid transaminase n=1 Tax=Podospora fimiseda TaxID=252190 RepID=A0AAN6YMS3_9PEZI|nr:Aromatic/aminoadipate aminotransferase 1 [Podospora fimiseda]
MWRTIGRQSGPVFRIPAPFPGPAAVVRRYVLGSQCYFHSKSSDNFEALATSAKLPEAKPVPPVTPSQRITVNDILERRAKSGRLVAPTAAACDADMFKAPSTNKPFAKKWDDHHLSKEAISREPCKLKQAARFLKTPGIISLGGGLPCPEYFPFSSLSMGVSIPPNFSESSPTETITINKYDASQGNTKAEYDLSIGLNYAQAHGSAQMMRFVTEHTELVHSPPYADWKTCLTVGSTGALEQALRLLCQKSRGDTILTEEFSFSTALETATPLGVKVVGVKMDSEGILPSSLDKILSNWTNARGGRRKPHVLYTVPSGQNPTGATQSIQRRREVYAIAQQHDLFIIEDEPYYFLQLQDKTKPTPENVDQFLDSLIPSLLSLDTDGRVLRMDSFSKCVVPGSRLGWITASSQIVERFIRHAEVANQGPSGFSQLILHKLLDETWGHEGYLKWLMNLRLEYTQRRDTLLAACEKYLPKEVATWSSPKAGMFFWVNLNHQLHPNASTKSILDVEEEIFNSCIKKRVLVARGSWFRAEQDKPPTGLFLRATFAAATPESMTEAIKRFGEAVRESYGL